VTGRKNQYMKQRKGRETETYLLCIHRLVRIRQFRCEGVESEFRSAEDRSGSIPHASEKKEEENDALRPRMLFRQPLRLPNLPLDLELTFEDVTVLLRLFRIELRVKAVFEAVDMQSLAPADVLAVFEEFRVLQGRE
jgi:hypothetical protein